MPARYQARARWIHERKHDDVAARFVHVVEILDGLAAVGLKLSMTEHEIVELAAATPGTLPMHAARRLRRQQEEALLEVARHLGDLSLWSTECRALKRQRAEAPPAWPMDRIARHWRGNSITRPNSPSRFAEHLETRLGTHQFFTGSMGWVCIAVVLSSAFEGSHVKPAHGSRSDSSWDGRALRQVWIDLHSKYLAGREILRQAGIPNAGRWYREVGEDWSPHLHLVVYAPAANADHVINAFRRAAPGNSECFAQRATEGAPPGDDTGASWPGYCAKTLFARDDDGRYLRDKNGDYLETASARFVRSCESKVHGAWGLPPIDLWRAAGRAGRALLLDAQEDGADMEYWSGLTDEHTLRVLGAAGGFRYFRDHTIQPCKPDYAAFLGLVWDSNTRTSTPAASALLSDAVRSVFSVRTSPTGDRVLLAVDPGTGREQARLPLTARGTSQFEALEKFQKSRENPKGVAVSQLISNATNTTGQHRVLLPCGPPPRPAKPPGRRPMLYHPPPMPAGQLEKRRARAAHCLENRDD